MGSCTSTPNEIQPFPNENEVINLLFVIICFDKKIVCLYVPVEWRICYRETCTNGCSVSILIWNVSCCLGNDHLQVEINH